MTEFNTIELPRPALTERAVVACPQCNNKTWVIDVDEDDHDRIIGYECACCGSYVDMEEG